MIEVDGVRKSFGDVVAVDDVSFKAEDGRITGLLGHNGAGKTTCMRMLSALIKPDAGEVRVDGIAVTAKPQQARRRLGVLPDAQGLYPRLTAREHMEYFGELQGMGGKELQRSIDALIERLDMGSIANRRTDGFSQGERMKVALGRALVHGPPNLVLDEPTNGLDVMSTRATRRLLRDLREEGVCVLFSSHVMQEVSALCDTIVVIADGRMVATGTAQELREQSGQESLEDAFVSLTHGTRELSHA